VRRATFFATPLCASVLALSALVACAHQPSPAPSAASVAAAHPVCQRAVAACTGAPPTYANDVRPILEKRCFQCHANGGVAADEHDFSRLETLRAQKVALAGEIGACAMPPSPEPTLPETEALTLLNWVACGARDR
jgi:hypothetical protein